MPFIPSPNIVQAEIRGLIGESNVENTLYFASTSPPVTVTSLEALANNLDAFWFAEMKPCLPTGYSFREIYVVDQTSITGPTYTAANGIWSGTRVTTGGMMPNNNTLSISFRTAQRGRSHRGRNYVCGLSRNDVVNNNVSVDLQTLLEDAYTELLPGGAYALAGWQWCVLSRRTNNAWRAQGLSTPVQKVVIVDGIIDTQRRRLPGRGH